MTSSVAITSLLIQSMMPSLDFSSAFYLQNNMTVGCYELHLDLHRNLQSDLLCIDCTCSNNKRCVDSFINLNGICLVHSCCTKTDRLSKTINPYIAIPRGGDEGFKGFENGRKQDDQGEYISVPQSRQHDSHPQSEAIHWISPKRLWAVARNVIGRTTVMLRRNRSENLIVDSEMKDATEDQTFAELDSILEKSTLTDKYEDRNSWLKISPSEGTSLLKRWDQQSLRSWINKIEHKFLSNETAQALKTIRKILESFPDYGVVDLFGLYSTKDVILSIIALSRLQSVESNYKNVKVESTNERDSPIDIETLNNLAYYAKFAHAAYGWKGLAAFCGRLHLGGDSRALVKRCGITRRDIIMANWHSKANRPAFFLVRDTDRKVLVLSIRGTLSPRDVLTDLCATCENFFVEDKPDYAEIGNIQCDQNPSNDSSEAMHSTLPIMIGRAHKGMVDAAKAVARMTGKTITDELQSAEDYSLVLVGHSLGGGVAATLTTMWRRRFADRICCIGYGMPCTFPFNDKRDKIISLIGEGDPFSVISLGHIADTTKALSMLCEDKGFRNEILKRTSANDLPQDDINFCMNAIECLRKQMKSEKLYPPGSIYLMAGSLFNFNIDRLNGNQEREDERIRRVDSSQFNELKIHPRLFDLSSHIPARYEAILERIISSSNRARNKM